MYDTTKSIVMVKPSNCSLNFKPNLTVNICTPFMDGVFGVEMFPISLTKCASPTILQIQMQFTFWENKTVFLFFYYFASRANTIIVMKLDILSKISDIFQQIWHSDNSMVYMSSLIYELIADVFPSTLKCRQQDTRRSFEFHQIPLQIVNSKNKKKFANKANDENKARQNQNETHTIKSVFVT